MLTIIHGDDIVSSRKYFLDSKDQHPDAVLLDGGGLNLTDLAQVFESDGIFEDTKTIFIEQFLSKKARGKKSAELTSLCDYIEKQSAEQRIFLWENKELEKSSLSIFKTADIKIFKFPQTLFLFLDSIRPGNGRQLISLFHKTIENSEVEMIFFMLVRQVRLLLALIPPAPFTKGGVPQDGGFDIDELKRMAPWQKDKLKRQASLFGKQQLIKLYADLFRLEIGQKTGGLASPLTSEIDFLLLEI